MDIKPDQLVQEIDGKVFGEIKTDLSIHRISTDTRQIEKNDVFFAIKGDCFDGHDFISEAFEKGARHFVMSEIKKIPTTLKNNANFICVADTVKAYGDLARFYRRQFKIPAVAITGSVGKTTVKELVAHLLSAKFKVLKNQGTENNLIGVPKTLFQLESSHEVIVLEMGTNLPGEIERLSSIIAPKIGILTQISPSHLEGLKNLEGVKKEKLQVLKNLEPGGVLILNGEDPSLQNVQSAFHKIRRVVFSNPPVETQLIGRHNQINCLLAIECAKAMGMEAESLKKSLSTFKPVPGRLNLKNWDDILFLDDSYNSNPGSFRAALETLKNFKIHGKKIVVCGDMLELGKESEVYHREMGVLIAKNDFDFVIACGSECKFLVESALKAGYAASKIQHVKDSLEAAHYCQKIALPGDLVLVKGSRGMQMEKVFECFISCSTP